MPSKSVVPTELSDRWELIVRELGERLYDKRVRVLEAVGARPYKGLPVSDDEVRERYALIRRDQTAWEQLLKENTKTTKDGKTLLPKSLIEKLTKLEAAHQPAELPPLFPRQEVT